MVVAYFCEMVGEMPGKMVEPPAPLQSRSLHRRAFSGPSPLRLLPFRRGPRVCIGERQALLNLQLSLVTILQKYQLHPLPGQSMEIHTAMTIRPKNGLMMRVSPAVSNQP